MPGRRLDEVADEPEQRRLAAAGRPDERDELALADGQVDRFERGDGRVAGPNTLLDARDLDDRGHLLGRHSAPSTGR